MLVEVLLELLIGKIDAELFKAVYLYNTSPVNGDLTNDKMIHPRQLTLKFSKPKISSTPMNVVWLLGLPAIALLMINTK